MQLPIFTNKTKQQTKKLSETDFLNKARVYGHTQTYKSAKYKSRAWGHKFHSLCSFQGKLKPSIAHTLVRDFSEPGQTVLDPLGGVGTVAFEATLQGRMGISNDINPFCNAVASAKLSLFNKEKILLRLNSFKHECDKYKITNEDKVSVEFGLNGKVKDYFHTETLREVLFFRNLFIRSKLSTEDLWIRANLLHILHGNRPYALSRISHPITPLHPSGDFNYKNVIEFVTNRIVQLGKAEYPLEFQPGKAIFGSYESLVPDYEDSVDLIITSPPFIGMRFDRPNWLRLWFMGWGAQDFHKTSLDFLERKQTKNFSVYASFFDTCVKILKNKGIAIIHLGGAQELSMADRMLDFLPSNLSLIHRFDENVGELERFGMRDRGRTKTHEFMFLQRKN